MRQATYRPEIDGLRAIAVLLVLLNHAGIPPFEGGFLGVDVFFVTSGYLITNIIIRELDTGSFTYRSFIARRARRILPALFVMLSVVSFAAFFVLIERDRGEFFRTLWSVATFWSNVRFYLDVGYFDISAAYKPLLHTWSLGIEEQFYILFPTYLVLVSRLGIQWRFVVTSVIAIASLVSAAIVGGDASFYLLPFRAWELLAGALVALWPTLRASSSTSITGNLMARTSVTALALVVILVSGVVAQKSLNWQALTPLAAVAATATLLFMSSNQGGILVMLAWRPLRVVGLASYSIYLWHYPLFSLVRYNAVDGLSAWECVLLLCVAVGVGLLSWRFVEQPTRDVLRTPMKRIAFASVAGTVLLTAAGVSLGSGAGRAQESESIEALNSETRVVLIGDSHAEHLTSGLSPWLGSSLQMQASPGCVPFLGVDRYDFRFEKGACEHFMRSAITTAIAAPQIEVVVLASMGPVYLTGQAFRGLDQARVTADGLVLVEQPRGTDRWEVYEIGLRNTLHELAKGNKRAVVVIDVPELGIEPQNCDPRRPDRCVNPRGEIDARTQRYRDLVHRTVSDYPNAVAFDPTALFCDRVKCVGILNGKNLYGDIDHLSEFGSEVVASKLGPLILKELARP
jgi:peptidoglycan/LPS O-acetylase OafA/YrhL